MYALRERRVHVTQEDFEMAVAKVSCLVCNVRGSHSTFEHSFKTMTYFEIFSTLGSQDIL